MVTLRTKYLVFSLALQPFSLVSIVLAPQDSEWKKEEKMSASLHDSSESELSRRDALISEDNPYGYIVP